ncbi:MAG TPA: ATP-binding protein [Solirubrobacteraceae bacterium]|nr:ATP-binding protein [Solirubrobacteraceae bacterium]
MTLETFDRTAERGAALRERAASACQVAAALCGDVAGLAEAVSVMGHSFAAEPTSVRRARTTVEQLAATTGVTGQRLEAIRLAVSEAATNAVMHAYPDRSGDFHLRAAVVGGRLIVRVTDDGCGPRCPPKTSGSRVRAQADRRVHRFMRDQAAEPRRHRDRHAVDDRISASAE